MNSHINSSLHPHPSLPVYNSDWQENGRVKETWEKKRLEYQKLIQIAQERKIDISEQLTKMQQVITDQPASNTFHQIHAIKMLYEIKMYEKYNREIDRTIAKHGLFYEKKPVFNMFKKTPKTLAERWEEKHTEYKKLVGIAQEKQVDISECTGKMQQVIADLPAADDLHQAHPIRMLYEIKMYQRYNRAISRLIEKHGYFQKDQDALLKELEWRIRDINYSYEKWVQKAAEHNVDIHEYTDKMQEAMDNLPSVDQSHQFSSVAMLYNVKLRKIYCIDIIRKVAETQIRRLAKEAKTTPGFEHLIELINGCEKFLLRHLPGADRKSYGEPNIEAAEMQYIAVIDKMEEMAGKIMQKRRIAAQPI
jgi:hypothetical protein